MKAAAHQLAQIENGLVSDLIPGEQSVLLPPDDPRGPKDRQVFRNVRLSRTHRFGEFLHRGAAISEVVKQSDSHRLANDAETLRYEAHESRRKWVGNIHGADYMTTYA